MKECPFAAEAGCFARGLSGGDPPNRRRKHRRLETAACRGDITAARHRRQPAGEARASGCRRRSDRRRKNKRETGARSLARTRAPPALLHAPRSLASPPPLPFCTHQSLMWPHLAVAAASSANHSLMAVLEAAPFPEFPMVSLVSASQLVLTSFVVVHRLQVSPE
jgi:hypothetical protein